MWIANYQYNLMQVEMFWLGIEPAQPLSCICWVLGSLLKAKLKHQLGDNTLKQIGAIIQNAVGLLNKKLPHCALFPVTLTGKHSKGSMEPAVMAADRALGLLMSRHKQKRRGVCMLSKVIDIEQQEAFDLFSHRWGREKCVKLIWYTWGVSLFLYYNCVLKMFTLRLKDCFRLSVKLQWSAKLTDEGDSEWIVGGSRGLRPGEVFRSTNATGAAVQSISFLLWVSPQEESAQWWTRFSLNLSRDVSLCCRRMEHLKICLSTSPAGMISYQQPLKCIITCTPRPSWQGYSQSIIEHGSDNKIGWLTDSLAASLRTTPQSQVLAHNQFPFISTVPASQSDISPTFLSSTYVFPYKHFSLITLMYT